MIVQSFHCSFAYSIKDWQDGNARFVVHKKFANHRSPKLPCFCFQQRRSLDLEHLLDFGHSESLLERGHGAVSHALDVGVDRLDGDALLDEGEGLSDGADNLGREAALDLGEELVGEGLVERGLDLCFYSQFLLDPRKLLFFEHVKQ